MRPGRALGRRWSECRPRTSPKINPRDIPAEIAGESSDTLTLYLRDVRRTELFTAAGRIRGRHARARRRFRRPPVDDRAQPAAGGEHRQGLPRARRAAVGPDRGRQPRPDARHRQVRARARLPLLDLRHLVDPPVGRARRDEPGPRDPAAGARGARAAAGAARAPHAGERPGLRCGPQRLRGRGRAGRGRGGAARARRAGGGASCWRWPRRRGPWTPRWTAPTTSTRWATPWPTNWRWTPPA